jgi:hypothetical protein
MAMDDKRLQTFLNIGSVILLGMLAFSFAWVIRTALSVH